MTNRCQLNLRLDGKRDLLEACKEVAAAEGLSLNAWVVRQLELGVSGREQSATIDTTRQPLDNIVQPLNTSLDKALDNQEASEPLGKLQA